MVDFTPVHDSYVFSVVTRSMSTHIAAVNSRYREVDNNGNYQSKSTYLSKWPLFQYQLKGSFVICS